MDTRTFKYLIETFQRQKASAVKTLELARSLFHDANGILTSLQCFVEKQEDILLENRKAIEDLIIKSKREIERDFSLHECDFPDCNAISVRHYCEEHMVKIAGTDCYTRK